MATEPVIIVCKHAAKDAINRMFAAAGEGETMLTREYHTEPGKVLGVDTPTHWLASHATADKTKVDLWKATITGDLPPVAPGVMWGVDGVIDAAEALAACGNNNMIIYSATPNQDAAEHLAGIITIAYGGIHAMIAPE